MGMKKKDAIEMFGSGAALGRALGISKAAIWQWPNDLNQKQTDMVVGAAVRLGLQLPELVGAPAQAVPQSPVRKSV